MSVYRRFLPYLVAIGATTIALFLSLWLGALLTRTIGAFFFLAVVLSTWYGGIRPGIIAVILSTLILDYYFLPPTGSIYISSSDDILRLGLFIVVALTVSCLSANLQKSKRKIEHLNRQLMDESSDRLKVALRAAQMGMWDWDIGAKTVTWSPEHEQLFGLPPGSFDGRYETFDACLYADDRAGVTQALADALQNRMPYHYEFRVVWPDGSLHWIEGRGQAFYNEDGQPIRMSGTIMAIDDRKQAQLVLQQQFEQQQLVMEMTHRIRQTLSLHDILQTTVDEVRQFLQVDRVILFQFARDWGGTVTVESVVDQALAIFPFNIYDPCIGDRYVEPFRQGLVTAKADIYHADISPCHVEFLAQFQVRANLVVPILKKDELWGLLAVHHCTAPRPWQDAEIDLLRQIAAQVGIALQQSALFEQVETELAERRQAELALQESERKLRLLIKYAPVGIAMLDREMRYIMASQRWIGDHHYPGSLESLINQSHYDVFPEIPERWRQIHQRCMAGAIEKCDEDLFLRAEGLAQWIRWEIHPWYTADTQIGGIIIFAEDITERRQAEKSLRQSEARLRLAQMASNSAVWDWDIGANTLTWSPEYYQLYGLDTTIEPNYENWLHCIHPDDRERVSQQTLQILDDPQAAELRVEFRVVRPDDIRWFAGIGQILRDEAGKALRLIGLTIDITEQKQTEIALQQFNAELERRVTERTGELTALNDRLLVALMEQQRAQQDGEELYIALRESEEKFRQLAENIEAVFWMRDGQGQQVVYVSPAYETIWQQSCESLYRNFSNWLDSIHPEDRPRVETAALQLTTIGHYDQEYRILRPDGSTHWIRDRAFSIRNEQGELLRVAGLAEDISDRKQAEAVLQQQSRLEQLRWRITQAIRQSLDLRAILNTAVEQTRHTLHVDRVAVYHFQPDWSGNFIAESVADRWVQLVGAGIERAWEDTYLQETQGGRFQSHEAFVVSDIYTAGLQPCHIELLEQFQAKAYAVAPVFSGETLWGLLAVYQNATARNWQTWEVELLQQIAIQLSIAIQQSQLYSQLQTELQERKQTEAVLREAERRWRSLLENVQLIVVELDLSGCIRYVNPFFLTLTGYTELEVIGKNWFVTCLPPSRQQNVQTVFSREIDQGDYPYYQDFILTKTGEERFIAWNNTRLQNFDGTVIGTISIGEDITERQKVEKIKDEFIGIVSHELRTPLTAIQMSLGLLKTGIYANRPKKAQRMIEIALIDTNRLVNLVNDILDLERLESGRTVLEKTTCRAQDLMQQAVDGVRAIATQQGITLTITPTDITVLAAADPIIQTLTNLLSNAIKFSPTDSEIHLRVEHQGDQILFQVSDQGRGIPGDKLETIFGRFQQVDVSDAREKGGTGLGLPICRSIIDRHGGKIWAESILGQGSTFFFTLPVPVESYV